MEDYQELGRWLRAMYDTWAIISRIRLRERAAYRVGKAAGMKAGDAFARGHQAGYQLAHARYNKTAPEILKARCAYSFCDVPIEYTQAQMEVCAMRAHNDIHRREIWLAYCAGQHGHPYKREDNHGR
jgi:hypothetical protein